MQRLETKARVRALQILYAWDVSGRPPLETAAARVAALYPDSRALELRSRELAGRAIAGVPEFDRRIGQCVEHWRLERVGVVERNVLRLALAELAEGSTPRRVVIDEAVKLAHWFAGDKAPAFVNGVLDAAARDPGTP